MTRAAVSPQSDVSLASHPEAERRLRNALATLRSDGIEAHGQIAHPDPFTAAMQAISDELHEAAAVDGATAFQRFRTITLPQLRPVILAITSLDFIWNFNSFGLVYVLTDGGPAHKTELPMLFAYNQAFKYGEFGYAAALGDAMVVVIAAALAFYLWGRLKEAR